MIHKIIRLILTNVVGILIGCLAALVTLLPFALSHDSDVPLVFQMIFMGIIMCFYLASIAPLVITAQLLLHKLKTHSLIPLFSYPIFGIAFILLGFLLVSQGRRYWPEEPNDMKFSQLMVFIPLVCLAIGTGMFATLIWNQKQKLKEISVKKKKHLPVS